MSVRPGRKFFSKRKPARLALLLVAAVIVWYFEGPETLQWPDRSSDLPAGKVTVEKWEVRVIDGDTFEIRGLRIRVLGIDTPEMSNPEYGMKEAQPYAMEAKLYARSLVDSASVVEYAPYRNDNYGRLLAHVFVDGELFGEKMILAGLAWETVSHYGDNGFPKLAARLTHAAGRAGRPPFEEPWIWRSKQRGKSQPLSLLPTPAGRHVEREDLFTLRHAGSLP